MTALLKPHPAAELFPMMSDAEINDLAADIKAHGQHKTIVVLNGQILDGRNRYEACRRAGVQPQVMEIDAVQFPSPTQWVLSENLHRRHLTVDQRALVALEASALFAKEAKDRQRAAGGDRRSKNQQDRLPPPGGKRSERAPTAAAKAAQTAGVSARSVERARRVQQTKPEVLERVRKGELTLKQAEKVVVKEERLKEVLAYTPPKGRFSVIVADPPWRYDDTLDGSDLARGGLEYPTMSVDEICAMKVGETMGTTDCALWLWVTNAFLIDGTATRVIRDWGFTPKALLTWDKGRFGAGRYLRNQTEHAILAIRGKPMVNGEKHGTVLHAPRAGHSVKPAEAFALFEAVTPAAAGARLELFAREPRQGWIVSGSEVQLPGSPADRTDANERELAVEAGRRLNGAGWKRAAAKAREEDSHTICHHCGAEAGDRVGGITVVPGRVPHTLCGGCEVRLRRDPEEYRRRQRVGPFQVHVRGSAIGPLHKDRNEAVHWAKDQGHRNFEVTWANGEVSDVVAIPAPAKKGRK